MFATLSLTVGAPLLSSMSPATVMTSPGTKPPMIIASAPAYEPDAAERGEAAGDARDPADLSSRRRSCPCQGRCCDAEGM